MRLALPTWLIAIAEGVAFAGFLAVCIFIATAGQP